MALTEARLTEASSMRGLEGTSNRVREDYGAPAGGGVLFTDDFAGTGALSASWKTDGFATITRNNGVAVLPQDAWACLLTPMSTTAVYAEITHTTVGTLYLTLSSATTTWTFPRSPSGYTFVSRNDGVAEAFIGTTSLGYTFFSAPSIGTRIRVENDGAGNLEMFRNGVSLRTWTDPGAPQAGTYVWLGGGAGEGDNFEAGDL